MEQPFVTILFTDLVGSTALFDRHGDDAADAIRREHFDALRRAVAEHGGREVKSTGDGLMVAFASAVAAIRCAVDMQRAASNVGDALMLRVGLHAGEPLADGDDLYGTPVNIASRLCDVAGAGEIVASDVVRQIAGHRVAELMQPTGALRLKGIAERVTVATVQWREDAAGAPPPGPTASPTQITVAIADDQRLLRAGFRVILDAEPDIKVVGEAADGRAAVDIVKRRRPTIVLMDIRMPELDGLSAAAQILDDPELDTAVLMLTTFDVSEYIYEALRIGATEDFPKERKSRGSKLDFFPLDFSMKLFH